VEIVDWILIGGCIVLTVYGCVVAFQDTATEADTAQAYLAGIFLCLVALTLGAARFVWFMHVMESTVRTHQ